MGTSARRSTSIAVAWRSASHSVAPAAATISDGSAAAAAVADQAIAAAAERGLQAQADEDHGGDGADRQRGEHRAVRGLALDQVAIRVDQVVRAAGEGHRGEREAEVARSRGRAGGGSARTTAITPSAV